LRAAADDRGSHPGQGKVEPPDQASIGLLLAAAQSSQEFRVVELGRAHEGLTLEDWSLCGEPRRLRNASSRAESSGIGGAAKGALRADMSRHERTSLRLLGAHHAIPCSRRDLATPVALRSLSPVFRSAASDCGAAWKPSAAFAAAWHRGTPAGDHPRTAAARSVKAVTTAQLTGNIRRTYRHAAYYSRANIGVETADTGTHHQTGGATRASFRSVRSFHDSQC
jgi:hypothetical protein